MTHELAQCLEKCGAGPILAPLIFREQPAAFQVLEVWKEAGDHTWRTQNSRMNVTTLKQKMEDEHTGKASVLLRIVCIPRLWVPHRYYLDVQAEQFEQLIDIFGLRKTYRFAHTSPMTFDIVPQQQGDTLHDLECSIFISRFLGLYFAHHSPQTTHGIIWCDKQILDLFEIALMNTVDLAQHPLHVLLVTMIALTSHIDHELTSIHTEINSVEQRTGHHGWEAITVPTANGSLAKLSARVSGNATSLASKKRITKLLCEMLAILKESSQSGGPQTSSPSTSPYYIEPTYFTILSRRFQNQLLQLDLIEARVNIQLTALFNLVTSQETNQNLEIAKDSKTIANATRRDSSSMKILAAVTVFFLPATFMASLFSTSMFDWNVAPGGEVVSSRFWVYWATVVPLTVGTMLACFVLSRRWADVARWEDKHSADDLSRSLEEGKSGFGL